MHLVVCAKQIPDPETPPSAFRIEGTAVGPAPGISPVLSPFDAQAAEAALLHTLAEKADSAVSREELIALYKHALALVYPSWFGPENLPPLEAFALGCPVVYSRFPGAAEQLGDAAVLIDPANPADIAAGITKLRADPALRSKLIQLGRERARRFTPSDYVRGMFGIIDRLEPILRCWRPSCCPSSAEACTCGSSSPVRRDRRRISWMVCERSATPSSTVR